MTNAHIARGKRYAAARARTGLSQRMLAKRLGLTSQAISKWENGESEPGTANARALADLAGVSLEWLLTGKDQNGAAATNVAPFADGRGRLVPEVGDTVQGVYPAQKRKTAVRFVQTYFPCSEASQALVVSGDSMAPAFIEGDVVVIDPNATPVPGDYVFVEVGTVKLFRRYRPQSGAGTYDLVPVNPDWPVEHVTPERHAVIKGVMVEHASPRRRG